MDFKTRLDFRRSYQKVNHPVLGWKYMQDGRFFFLDGAPCLADPNGKSAPARPAAPAPAAPPPQETRTVIGRVEDPGEQIRTTEAPAFMGKMLYTEEQLGEMSWPEIVKLCKDTGLELKNGRRLNKQAAIHWLTKGALPA